MTARSDGLLYTLLTNASATGAAVHVRGGTYMWLMDGAAGGATFQLQIQLPVTGTWTVVSNLPVAAGAMTSTTLPDIVTPLSLPDGNYRLQVSGGSPSGVYAWLMGLG